MNKYELYYLEGEFNLESELAVELKDFILDNKFDFSPNLMRNMIEFVNAYDKELSKVEGQIDELMSNEEELNNRITVLEDEVHELETRYD